MIHVVTTHVGSGRWVEPQRERLERHTSESYVTWAALGGEASRHADAFESRGQVAPNLHHLADEVADFAADDDILVFLDGDAFPIADWTARARRWIAELPSPRCAATRTSVIPSRTTSSA